MMNQDLLPPEAQASQSNDTEVTRTHQEMR